MKIELQMENSNRQTEQKADRTFFEIEGKII